ncbi:MAG: hypothetical protein E6H51_09335 [Betaproteobacteria bacterium]|nr:MAG: hypothetical protein E6H51_09335 [Betaproteobacteria bacterium]
MSIFLVHFTVSAVLWVLAILDTGAVSFYSTVFFFLWNIPAVWVLKGLGLSAMMDSLGFTYGGPLMAIGMLLLLATALIAFAYARRAVGA